MEEVEVEAEGEVVVVDVVVVVVVAWRQGRSPPPSDASPMKSRTLRAMRVEVATNHTSAISTKVFL